MNQLLRGVNTVPLDNNGDDYELYDRYPRRYFAPSTLRW